MLQKKLVSIIVPVYNEEKNIALFHKKLIRVIDSLGYSFEVIYVNDGSSDKSLLEIEKVSGSDSRVKYIDFSRNFGKEIATTCGINNCQGDACIMIDADLQHSVELIPDFLKKWEGGSEVVIGIRKGYRREDFVKKIGSMLFYKIIRSITDFEMIPNATDFRLIDRIVIDEFNRFKETNRMTRALIDWLGFRRSYIYFEVGVRQNGKSNYTFWKLFRLAMNGFVSLSFLPLKLAGYLGIAITLTSGTFGLYILISKYLFGSYFAGDFTGSEQLAVLTVFLVGIILVSLGLIALYIANIHDEVIGRPMYVVRRKKLNSEKS